MDRDDRVRMRPRWVGKGKGEEIEEDEEGN